MDNNDASNMPKIHVLPMARESFISSYLTGFGAACCAEVVAYPFDLTKTRMHIQGEVASKTGKDVVRHNMFGIARNIIQEEGFLKLYSGLTAMVLRHSVFTGLKMTIYSFMRNNLMEYDSQGKEQFSTFRSSLSGIVGGAGACLVSSPTDQIKVQMQMEGKRRLMGLPPRIKNVGQAFTDIYKTGGLRGLWKGAIPNAQRAALVTMADVSIYDLSKRKILSTIDVQDGMILQFVCAMVAGLVGVALSCPADVVKSRVMNQPVDEKGQGLHYKNSIDCLKKLIQKEGVTAIYKGAIPYWLRLGPWTLTFWLSLEQIRKLSGQSYF